MGYVGSKPSAVPLTSADITDGIITNADIATTAAIATSKLGAGAVLQVVTATDATERTTTSTSYVTGSNTLSASITPSSASNKILILVSSSVKCNGNSTGSYTVYRGASNLVGASGFIRTTDGNVDVSVGLGINYLDSPATTSSTTYQVYFKASANTAYLNTPTGATGSITLLEIKG